MLAIQTETNSANVFLHTLCFAIQICVWWERQSAQHVERPSSKLCTAVVIPLLPQCIFFSTPYSFKCTLFIPKSLLVVAQS